MYLNFEVELPDQKTGISKKKIKGTTYIYYEYGRKYLADRKYNVPQCTSIGKLSDNDPSMMIPNSNYLKFFPDAELPVELPESVRSLPRKRSSGAQDIKNSKASVKRSAKYRE